MSSFGDVILTARRAKGLTHAELIDDLGVTQAALSRYENNLREPDEAMLEKLSKALDVSIGFLTHPFRLQGAIAADAHMRRQKSTKVSDWKIAEARLNLLRMRSAYLFERVPMQTDSYVPTFDPGETSPADAARLTRAQWRLPVGPVRNLTRWLESAGILVVEERLGTRRIDGLSQWAGTFPVIMVNADLPTDRKRLTLAHELGHLVLHATYTDLEPEAQANTFAAELLMPEHVIRPTLCSLTLGRLLDLKLEWGTSMQAILEHAYRLGRVTVDERQRLDKAMNARGWKTTEPGSDRLPSETPELIHLAGDRLRTAGLSDDEIAQLTGARTPDQASPFLRSTHQLHVV